MNKVLPLEDTTRAEPMWLELRKMGDFVFPLEQVQNGQKEIAWDMDEKENPIIYFPGNYAFSCDTYEKYWRCWNNKPTNEERKKVRWK